MRNYHYQGGEVLYTDDGTQTDAFRLLGPGGNAISTVHMGSTGEVWYLYGSDIRGSITTLTDENGDIAAAYDYEEFGETEALAGADVDNEVGYTGQIRDRESGLYYYNARYYDPAYGRFLTQDTCRGEQTDPQTLHLYAYCANDPVNHTDPSGHSEKTIKASKTVKYYSPVIDAGHIVWRITATLSVTYKKSGKKRTIKKMNFWAVGDKHTNCGNGTCRFNKVKLYKSKKLWKTIKGTDKVVVPGDGLWLKQSQICYTDKKIDKTYKMGAKKTRVVAFFYFMPPPEALFRAGVEIKPEVSF